MDTTIPGKACAVHFSSMPLSRSSACETSLKATLAAAMALTVQLRDGYRKGLKLVHARHEALQRHWENCMASRIPRLRHVFPFGVLTGTCGIVDTVPRPRAQAKAQAESVNLML